MIKVSIIVPVYGVEKYIEKCARSIFEQTYSNLEIIFVDDCSPDASIEILKRTIEEYPERQEQVRILRQESNKGVAAARKRGMESAVGEFTIQFDSDDYVDPKMIETLVSEANRTQADIVICDFNLIMKGNSRQIHVNPSLNPIDCMKQVLKGQVHSSFCNKLIRRDLYTKHDIWPIEGLNMREDLSVMYRLLYFAKKLSYVPIAFYNYVLREGSVSSERMSKSQQQDAQKLLIHINGFVSSQFVSDKSIIEAICYLKAQILSSILLYGDINRLDCDQFLDVKLQHFITHPKISFYDKFMGFLYVYHMKSLINFFRKIIIYILFLK